MAPMRLPGALLLLGPCLLPPASASAAADPVVLESEHYRLLAWPPFAEGEEYLRLSEALYGLLKGHFGTEPKVGGKLEVLFWPDRDGFLAGGKADGIPEGSLQAGGIYWTGTRRACFWRQPSASFTRHLFLHELTHQFHYLAVMDNRARCPGWYAEGLAEYFGYHSWDGATLVPGASDVLGLEEDIPRMAEEGRGGAYDLAAVIEGKRGADKPPSWAAVHYFLRSGHPKVLERFRDAERKMWRGLSGKPLVDQILGPDRKAQKAAAQAHLASLRTTWKVEWTHWDARGADPVGESPVVALLRTREPAPEGGAFVEATLEPERGSAGLVLGFRSTDDFLAVYRRPGGRIEIVRRVKGGWETLASADGPSGDSVRLKAEADGAGTVRVRSGDATILECAAGPGSGKGSVGLFVDAGKARFRGVVLP